MKKIMFVVMFFITFSLFAQELNGKWDYVITYDGGATQTGIVQFNKSTIKIDDTYHKYFIEGDFIFIDSMGYFYKRVDDVITLTPSFGGRYHVMEMKRRK